MEFLLLICYDAIAVVILLLAVSKSARVGFAQTITEVLGRIVAFFAALFVGKAGSQLIYTLFLDNRIMRFLEETIADSATASEVLESISQAAETLPAFMANFYGLTGSQLQSAVTDSVVGAVRALEEQVVEPAVTGFLHIVIFLITFAALCFLVHHLSKAVGLVFKLPVIKTVDRFCGGILGILQGGINLYLIALLVRFALYFISDPPAFLNEGLIMDTMIWSRVYEFNPFKFLK